MIKKGIFYAAAMVLICSVFILTTEIVRQPDIDSVCEYMLTLEEYSGAKQVTNPPEVYNKLYQAGADKLRVYKTPDNTACEFAVLMKKEDAYSPDMIEIFDERSNELRGEFAENAEELKRIDDARTIIIDDFVIYAVCDTLDTAENAVHKYFSMR